jgi:hypothetical protein
MAPRCVLKLMLPKTVSLLYCLEKRHKYFLSEFTQSCSCLDFSIVTLEFNFSETLYPHDSPISFLLDTENQYNLWTYIIFNSYSVNLSPLSIFYGLIHILRNNFIERKTLNMLPENLKSHKPSKLNTYMFQSHFCWNLLPSSQIWCKCFNMVMLSLSQKSWSLGKSTPLSICYETIIINL